MEYGLDMEGIGPTQNNQWAIVVIQVVRVDTEKHFEVHQYGLMM